MSHPAQIFRQYRALMDAALAVKHPLERAYLKRRANLMLVDYLAEVDRLAEADIERGTGVFALPPDSDLAQE